MVTVVANDKDFYRIRSAAPTPPVGKWEDTFQMKLGKKPDAHVLCQSE